MNFRTPTTISNQIFISLLIYAVLFFPAVYQAVSPEGWLSYVYRPQWVFLLASVWIYFSQRLSPQRIGWTRPRMRFFARSVGLAIFILIVMYATHFLIQATYPKPYDPLLPYNLTFVQMFFLFLIAPFTEELFFRGILFGFLVKRYPLWIAILTSSLLFMATHQDLWLGSFLLGVITAYWTHTSKSIFPGMLFHALSNSFVLFAHSYAPSMGAMKQLIFW